MTVERAAWTDERLDDFTRHVDVRFDAVDRRFDRVETGIRDLRVELVGEFSALRTTMMRGFIGAGSGIIIALIGVIAALIGAG